MDTIKKTHPYIEKIYMISYILSIICLLIYFYCLKIFFIYIVFLCILICGLMYYFKNKTIQQELNILIQNADAIIEHQDVHIIDGEGDISVLSHKLYTLNKRYYSLTSQMQKDSLKLKDYIEDISHQLKTPITSMRLNEELLLEQLQGHQKEQLEHIYTQTLKMNSLVNDLLTLAKIESHSITFEFKEYDIELLLDEIEESLHYFIIQNDVHMIYSHHHQSIVCDRQWFEEAMINILKNYIEKNSQQTIEISIEEYETLQLIKIRDYGKGFYEEDLPHLFERFYRGIHNDYQGVGIGLALAKEIVEEHHGFIKAYNEHGAVIEISLPRLLVKKKL